MMLQTDAALTVEWAWVTAVVDVAGRLGAGAPVACRLRSGKRQMVAYSLRRLSGQYELMNCGNGKAYLLDSTLTTCSCGDALYRMRIDGCKHRKAIRGLLAEAGVVEGETGQEVAS